MSLNDFLHILADSIKIVKIITRPKKKNQPPLRRELFTKIYQNLWLTARHSKNMRKNIWKCMINSIAKVAKFEIKKPEK